MKNTPIIICLLNLKLNETKVQLNYILLYVMVCCVGEDVFMKAHLYIYPFYIYVHRTTLKSSIELLVQPIHFTLNYVNLI